MERMFEDKDMVEAASRRTPQREVQKASCMAVPHVEDNLKFKVLCKA
jgi:hypothetical protein